VRFDIARACSHRLWESELLVNPILWVSILSVVLLVIHLYQWKGIASPIGIFHSLLWLGVSLSYAIWQADLEVISTKTLWIIGIGIAMFSGGFLAGIQLKPLPAKFLHPEGVFTRMVPLPTIIVAVSVIGLASMLHQALALVSIDTSSSLVGSGSWYARLRLVLVSEKAGSYGLASYVLNFSFVGSAYLAYMSRIGKSSRMLGPSILLSLGFCFLATGRTYLILFGCLMLAAVGPSRQNKRIVLLITAMATLVAVTWVGGRFNQASVGAFLASMEHHAKLYFVAPVAALNYLINLDLPSTGGGYTFRTLLAVLKAMGMGLEVPDLIQPYPNVKLSANVYTVFSPYYRDFGVAGVALLMALLGLLHGWILIQINQQRSFLLIVASGILCYALLMQFFQDQYFSLLSQWIQLIGWAYVFSLLQCKITADIGSGH